jgi:integrase
MALLQKGSENYIILHADFGEIVHLNRSMLDVRFHGLRHTADSIMLNHGVPVIVVSRRVDM